MIRSSHEDIEFIHEVLPSLNISVLANTNENSTKVKENMKSTEKDSTENVILNFIVENVFV